MYMDNEGTTLATELLAELKRSARRWFIAFLIMLGLELATIASFIWYISLPVEDTTVTQEIDDGDNNTVVGIGDNYGQADSAEKEESSTEETQEKVTE